MIEIWHKNINTPADEIQAYNQIYGQEGIRHLDSLYLWILRLLQVRPGQSLLDVSTGEGTLIHFAAVAGLEVMGLDFSPMAVQKGCLDYQLTTLSLANAENLPIPDLCFDYVTNVGSVEHYFNPAAAIQEMSRVLKPNGVACILLPNAFSLFGNVQYVWQAGDVFDDGQPIQRYNTRMGWHRLLSENGLQPFRTVKYERVWPQCFADWGWYIRRPSKLAKLMITPFIPLNLANSLVYLCHPK